MPTTIVAEILKIGATLLSIFSKYFAAKQSPAEVETAVKQFHQDLKDHEAAVDQVLADPKATAADHAAALAKLRMAQS